MDRLVSRLLWLSFVALFNVLVVSILSQPLALMSRKMNDERLATKAPEFKTLFYCFFLYNKLSI